MKRREVLKLGGMAVIAGAPFAALEKTSAQQAVTEGHTPVLHIYSDAQGNSHLEEVMVVTTPSGRSREARPLSVIEVNVKEYGPSDVDDWHTTPFRQFGITIVGELEVEVSGGVRRRVGHRRARLPR